MRMHHVFYRLLSVGEALVLSVRLLNNILQSRSGRGKRRRALEMRAAVGLFLLLLGLLAKRLGKERVRPC